MTTSHMPLWAGSAAPESEEAPAGDAARGSKDQQTQNDSLARFLVNQAAQWLHGISIGTDISGLEWRPEVPVVTRGRPTRKPCAACDAQGPHRHTCTFAHTVDVRGFPGPTLSLFSGTICKPCAEKARAADEAWIEALRERRREGVRDRILAEYLDLSPTVGGPQ
jgi:hypothetical protein